MGRITHPDATSRAHATAGRVRNGFSTRARSERKALYLKRG
jgi:hypothetical protein